MSSHKDQWKFHLIRCDCQRYYLYVSCKFHCRKDRGWLMQGPIIVTPLLWHVPSFSYDPKFCSLKIMIRILKNWNNFKALSIRFLYNRSSSRKRKNWLFLYLSEMTAVNNKHFFCFRFDFFNSLEILVRHDSCQ